MLSTIISSGSLSASTLFFTGKALLAGVCVGADGTNPVTVTIYDNTSAVADAAHPILWQTVVPAGVRNQTVWFPNPIQARYGLYVAVSATAGQTVIAYRA